jgi:hypothetical protein
MMAVKMFMGQCRFREIRDKEAMIHAICSTNTLVRDIHPFPYFPCF